MNEPPLSLTQQWEARPPMLDVGKNFYNDLRKGEPLNNLKDRTS